MQRLRNYACTSARWQFWRQYQYLCTKWHDEWMISSVKQCVGLYTIWISVKPSLALETECSKKLKKLNLLPLTILLTSQFNYMDIGIRPILFDRKWKSRFFLFFIKNLLTLFEAFSETFEDHHHLLDNCRHWYGHLLGRPRVQFIIISALSRK